MYARRATRPKPRTSQSKKWIAPIAGWIANRALSDPKSLDGPGAEILDNFYPKATSVVLRRGKQRYATLEDETLPVTALFSYRNGLNERLFAANESKIYDLTTVPFPFGAEIVTEDGDTIETETGDFFGWSSTSGLDVMGGFNGGDWIVTQFATTGGVYLIGVNGVDTGFIFDGEDFYPYVQGGVSRLNYDAETVSFTEGDTVTGGTSGATATVWRVVDQGSGTGYLLIYDIVGGPFQDNETLTDGDGGSADAVGVEALTIPGATFGAGLTSADMSFVWVYKNRLWFAQKDSMNAWFMTALDAVGGATDVFPLGGVFTIGGSLLFGASWSLDAGGAEGLSAQCIFVSSLGEVAVYQGADPQEASTWNQAGIYRIGKPLGNRAFIRGGGDLAIATSVGLVPLSKAISLDVTALNVASVSYKISDAWSTALTDRGDSNWICEIWPEAKMAVVSPPDLIGSTSPVLFISNTDTGAWARFTGWHALAMEVFRGRLYFGSPEGRVYTANVAGNDDGDTYTGIVMPLFEDLGSVGSAKIGKMARARGLASASLNDSINMMVDFNRNAPSAPNATALSSPNVWDAGIWGQSTWGSPSPTVISQAWRSIGGVGYSLSLCYQVTSGSVAPLDAELIDMEMLYTTAELVT
ncbi:hypothetical protein [Rhizorhapis suberifaciens]|uniref:Uncharacterized protein n=1 Tax=Rhizorhapis suberifaciens TaxID=13656 RepID=A0A840HXT6_9SPHN|nr:hypothetical protein [Rhizorhapis suberifaciens]MBB4642370.1 hypothetical protein [Rhizorhapis suberifaciens]